MYGLLIGVHIIACLILIAVILLQAGRGGGLSDAFGGGLEQKMFGTRTASFFTRITAVAAAVFILASLSLAVLSTRKGRSLIEMERVEEEIAGEEIRVEPGEEEPAPVTTR